MDQSLASVMRNINNALRLDDDSHDKEAYMKYLDCILCITCNLQQSVREKGGDVVISKQVAKQVKLAQQCIDRVAVLVDKIGSTQKPMVLKSPSDETRANVKLKPFAAVPPLPSEPAANSFARTRRTTPMEIAYKQNQQLMTAYRARMARMNKGDPGAFNLSLTLQRKMAENLALAKRTEMALAKKMQERQERLEEQAAKRFAAPVGMSEEEQEQRQIYKKILDYEQDAKWLQNWRAKLDTNPEEPELICQLIQEILRCRDHPLTLLLKQYQYKIYEKIYPLVSTKKQRLATISVPLARSLWPPELCNDGISEECRLSFFPGAKASGDGKNSDEDSGISQSGHEHVSQSDSGQGEETVVKQGNDENLSVSSSETVVKTHTSSENNSVTDGKEMATGGIQSDTCESGGKSQDHTDPIDISADSSALSANAETRDSVSPSDSSKQPVRKSDKRGNIHALESVHHDVKPESCDNKDSKEMTIKNELDCDTEVTPELKTDQEKVIETDNENSLTASTDSEESVKPGEDENKEGAHEDSSREAVAQFTENTKKDLSQALDKGKCLQTHLESEQAKAARILQQITCDYEQYNAENMDDLFDDEDDDNGPTNCSVEVQPENPECDLPESEQPTSLSVSSQGGPDSLISRSSSGGSVQDFPSLPSVPESQAEMERLSKEAYQRHVKNISADVHMYMEKLLVLFTIAYEQLDSPVGRDQCYASLEETFFKPLWKFLLMLFRLAHYRDELEVACKMTQKGDASPKELGVTEKLRLLPLARTDSSSERNETRPYEKAITQLMCIKDHYTMLSKLECIVKVVHQVCDSVKDFYTSQGYKPADVPSVGADDLLPVISYVVMQSRLPQLVSECHAMSEFIHEGYIMGQEGYCLTTLETAVSYIVSSDLNIPCSP